MYAVYAVETYFCTPPFPKSAYRLLHTGFGIQASAYRLWQTDSVQQAQHKKLNCSGQADAQQEIPTCFDFSSSCLFWMIACGCYIESNGNATLDSTSKVNDY